MLFAEPDQLSQANSGMLELLQVTQLPPQLTGKVKTKEWMAKLHGMPASKKLSEDDVRQLMFDLESSYNEFMSKLNETS